MSAVEIVLWIANFVTLGLFGLALSGVLRRQKLLDHGGDEASGGHQLGPREGRPLQALEDLAPDRAEAHEFIFLSVTCRSCVEVALAIGRRVEAQPEYADHVTVLFEGDRMLSFPPSTRVLSEQSDVFAKAGVSVVPYAVTVEAGKVVASSPVTPSETSRSNPAPSNGSHRGRNG